MEAADPRERPRRSRLVPVAVVALLAAHAALLTETAFLDAPTWDEPSHLAAGLWTLETGSRGLYRVNPPLVRTVAAIPVALSPHAVDWSRVDESPTHRGEFTVGRGFVDANGGGIFHLVSLARLACLPFSVLGGLACFWWARRLRGNRAGLFALTLWCFDPFVVGHGHLITSDVAAAGVGLAAWLAAWSWLERPRWRGAILAGVLLGGAQLTKFTWVILWPLLPALWLLWAFGRRDGRPRRELEAAQLAAALLVSLVVLQAGYGFHGCFRRLDSFGFVSRSLAGDAAAPVGQRPVEGNRFEGSPVGALPVPVPAEWLRGIDRQRRDMEGQLRSYVNGRFQQGGWWWFYLYGLAVKMPLGTLAIFALALASAALPTLRSRWRDELFLLAPALVAIALVSSQTGMTHHVRYVLPALPFLFVASARIATWPTAWGRWLAVPAWLALLAATVAGLRSHPHQISFFNVAAGGPEHGAEHLLDSNVDWGQDLLHLGWWLRQHPEAQDLHLAYFGSVDPRHAGITYTLPPTAPAAGWHAVSVNFLHGYRHFAFDGTGASAFVRESDYRWLRDAEPVARAGWSIDVYRIDEADARRLTELEASAPGAARDPALDGSSR